MIYKTAYALLILMYGNKNCQQTTSSSSKPFQMYFYYLSDEGGLCSSLTPSQVKSKSFDRKSRLHGCASTESNRFLFDWDLVDREVNRTHHHEHKTMKLTSRTVSRINSTSDQGMNVVVVTKGRSAALRETGTCAEQTGQESRIMR